jgi:hypothetical protein
MKKIETLSRKVEELRTDLKSVLEAERELIDPEVIEVSQSLDKVLIQYYRTLIRSKCKIL